MGDYRNPRARALAAAAATLETAAMLWAVVATAGPVGWVLVAIDPVSWGLAAAAAVVGGVVAWFGLTVALVLVAGARGYAEQLDRLTAS